MLSHLSNVNTNTSFKGIITGTKTVYKRGKKVPVDLFAPITSTPDMDQAISSQLQTMGCGNMPKKISVKSFDIADTPDFKKLMDLMHLPDEIIPSEGTCSIEEIRHQVPKGKNRATYRDIKITINSTISILLDLNKRNQGLVSIREIRKALRP